MITTKDDVDEITKQYEMQDLSHFSYFWELKLHIILNVILYYNVSILL